MKLRKKIALMAAMSFTLPAIAYSGIEVSMTDGSSVVISMNEHPVITFSGDKLVVKTVESTTELDCDKVKKFIYMDTSDIREFKSDDVSFVYDLGRLMFSNLPVESRISICDLRGSLCHEAVVSGSYSISLSDLSSGIYIVNVNGVSTKIKVKR